MTRLARAFMHCTHACTLTIASASAKVIVHSTILHAIGRKSFVDCAEVQENARAVALVVVVSLFS